MTLPYCQAYAGVQQMKSLFTISFQPFHLLQEWQKKMQDKMDLDLERELISAEAEQMLQKKNKDITKDQYGRPELGSLDSDDEDEGENGKEARPLSEKEIQDLD